MAGFGTVTWWGFSPPLDLLQEIETMNSRRNVDMPYDKGNVLKKSICTKELNVLLVGAADVRHIFKTIAQGWRHTQRKINFYVMENNIEVICRDIILLKLVTEPTSKMGFQEKTELFLEIFGNSLVRHQTAVYVQEASKELKKMVTDLNYMEEKLPFLDLNNFRYKDRDSMDGVFNFWKNPDMNMFDIRKFWEHRQRQYLGTRYDTRLGAFDWDYNMKLVDKDAGIINYNHYKKWRNTGVAFELRDADYNVPNRTLASGLLFKHEGDHYLRRGYWGDIVTGPYIAAFGIECEDKSYFEKGNEIYRKTAQDVASRNVLSLLHELVLHKKVKNPVKDKEKECKQEETEKETCDRTPDLQSKEGVFDATPNKDTLALNGNKEGNPGMAVIDDALSTCEGTLKTNGIDGHHGQSKSDNQMEETIKITKTCEPDKLLTANGNQPTAESIGDILKEDENRPLNMEKGSVGEHGDQAKLKQKNSETAFSRRLQVDEATTANIAKDLAKSYRVIFLSQKYLLDLHQRDRFSQLFNLVYYANSMVHVLKPEMRSILAPDAVILLETAKFLIDLKKEQVTEFVGKLVSIAGTLGCKAATPCDPKLDAVARFYYDMKED